MAARLEKRNDVYYAWVKDFAQLDKRTKRLGKWRFLTTGCTDRKAAERRAAELEREYAVPAADRAAHEAPLTLDAATVDFFAGCVRRNKAAGTIDCYRKKARHLLAHFGAAHPIAAIRARDVNAYVDKRLAQGAQRSTVQKELVALRGILTEARERYPHDVAKTVEPFDAEYDPRTRWLKPHEYEALAAFLSAPRRPDGKMRNFANQGAAFRFIVATGARDAEMQRACVGDVDLERGLVMLRTSKTRKKTGPIRWVPITPVHREALEAVVEVTKGRGAGNLMFDGWLQIRRDLHWATEHLWPCERAKEPRHEAKDCAVCKERRVSPNDLRRTHGMWLRKAGVRREDIAAIYGHKGTRMVDTVYAKLEGEDLRERVMAQLGEKT